MSETDRTVLGALGEAELDLVARLNAPCETCGRSGQVSAEELEAAGDAVCPGCGRPLEPGPAQRGVRMPNASKEYLLALDYEPGDGGNAVFVLHDEVGQALAALTERLCLRIPYADWVLLEEPKTLTVTLEPGDETGG